MRRVCSPGVLENEPYGSGHAVYWQTDKTLIIVIHPCDRFPSTAALYIDTECAGHFYRNSAFFPIQRIVLRHQVLVVQVAVENQGSNRTFS